MNRHGFRGLAPALLALCLLLALNGPEQELPVPASGTAQVPDERSIPLVALTFDDGPRSVTTADLLDGLALREVPATFFLVGSCIGGREELVRRMADEGHQIGVHTYDHIRVTGLSRGEFDRQMDSTRALLWDILGQRSLWLRPPYGMVDSAVCRWADCPLILWSVDTEDWKDKNVSRIVTSVLEQVKDGDIILMHDIYPTSVQAALQIVDALQARGFCFVTVEQLMALREETPQAGQLYLSLPPEE